VSELLAQGLKLSFGCLPGAPLFLFTLRGSLLVAFCLLQLLLHLFHRLVQFRGARNELFA